MPYMEEMRWLLRFDIATGPRYVHKSCSDTVFTDELAMEAGRISRYDATAHLTADMSELAGEVMRTRNVLGNACLQLGYSVTTGYRELSTGLTQWSQDFERRTAQGFGNLHNGLVCLQNQMSSPANTRPYGMPVEQCCTTGGQERKR